MDARGVVTGVLYTIMCTNDERGSDSGHVGVHLYGLLLNMAARPRRVQPSLGAVAVHPLMQPMMLDGNFGTTTVVAEQKAINGINGFLDACPVQTFGYDSALPCCGENRCISPWVAVQEKSIFSPVSPPF